MVEKINSYTICSNKKIFIIFLIFANQILHTSYIFILFLFNFMGCTLKKDSSGEIYQSDSQLNLVLNNIGKQVNRILQNQAKNLETTISQHAKMIRQQMREQTKYLKTIAENVKNSSTQVSQIKMGDIKNKNEEKAIKITHQSLMKVQLQQSLQQKQSIQKNQKNIIESKKPIKINEMVPQMPQFYMQQITEIYNRIQKIQLIQFQFIKERLRLQKNDPILSINKNSNQIQKTGGLELLDNNEKNRVNIDYKDRFIVMPLVKYNKYQNINMMGPWISDLYEKLSEEAFYGYLHKHMTKEQMKACFSQNFILNTVKMIRSLREKDQQTSVKQILKKFGEFSDSALEFQLKKYPQKKKIFIRPQIQNMVEMCQNNEDSQYDILKNMKFRYQYDKNGIYYKQIKLMINNIISLTNQHFQEFQKQMKKIFVIKWEQKQQLKKQDQIIKEENIKKDQNIKKKQKINKQQKRIPKDYIQHQIGRKINQNTPQFEKHQINTNKITIQSPQIMRIIIKWIQELEDKIQNLEKNIDNRYYPFISQYGEEIQYSKQDRQNISRRFKQYLSQHKQYKLEKNLEMLQNIQSQMINYIDINSKSFAYISQNNIEVGLTTHLLSETIQEIAIKRLNQVLHSILSFQKKQSEFGKVDYITFSVYDLLRSRCTGNFQKVKLVYDQLKQNKNFKIIRVKNRLSTGNRDFLINMQFKNTPIICELQLGLILEKSSINQKQDRLGDFNHFLYQLKRSKYGPLTQAVLLNANYSQTITFFQQKLKKIKFQKQRRMKIQYVKPKRSNNGKIQITGYDIQEQQIIIVCHNCLQIKYTKTSFLNAYKQMKKESEGQYQYLCGQCVVNSLQIFDRNKYLLPDYISQYFQQTNQDEMLKNNSFGESCYYLIISNDKRRYIVKRLDKDYFIQQFSPLVSQKYSFLKINQLNIKYVYQLSKQIDYQNNIIKIHNVQELNLRAYINQQRREFLIKHKEKWKQAICIEGKKGCLLIDATKEQDTEDYKSNLNLFIKTRQIKKLKQSKIQYMDLGFFWGVDQQFFIQNLKEVTQIKKLNLSENHLTDIHQIIKGKNILELKLNSNKLQSVIIPIQSLIRLQIRNNQLVKVDFSALINLQILDLSYNQIENIELDKLVKLKYLNLHQNKLNELTLNNKQCKTLKLYFINNLQRNQLTKLDISKMDKLNELNLSFNIFEQLVLENPELEILHIAYNKLKKINIQKLINLKQFVMYHNQLQNLTLINSKLQFVHVSTNKLTSVNFKGLVHLKSLSLSENNLQQLYLDSPLLEILYMNDNYLQNLDFSKLLNLKQLYANSNQLTQFPEIELKSLQILQLHYNKLMKINLDAYSKLREVNVCDNQLDEFIVGNIPLQKINARNNKIKKVDITKLNKIQLIDFSCNKIQQIMLKNESLQQIWLQCNQIYNINIDKLTNLKKLDIFNNCITNINVKKKNNPKLNRIWLTKSLIFQVDIDWQQDRSLTEQQMAQITTQDDYRQMLSKLRLQKISRKEALPKIIQIINEQYNNQIIIE